MDLNLKGKIVLISGGAGIKGSIGETMVQHLADEGAIPVIIDRNARGFQMEKDLQARGIDGMFVQTHLNEHDDCKNAVEKAIAKYGRVDVLINNAGVNDGVSLEGSYDDFMYSLKLNLVSYFLLAKYALPKLKESKGTILNIGSKVSVTGQGGTSGYAAAKGGVLALTREWAVDLIKFGIRVNAIIISESWTPAYDNWLKTLPNPEEAKTKIVSKIPFENRMTEPSEIANTALFVISDKSSHTTGQFIFVDGGYVHLDRALLTDD